MGLPAVRARMVIGPADFLKRLAASVLAILLLVGPAVYGEESATATSGVVKPMNIAVGIVTGLRKIEGRIWLELKTGARTSVKLIVPNWTNVTEEGKPVPFKKFYALIATGDKLSVKYTTNNEWDWISADITVLKRRK